MAVWPNATAEFAITEFCDSFEIAMKNTIFSSDLIQYFCTPLPHVYKQRTNLKKLYHTVYMFLSKNGNGIKKCQIIEQKLPPPVDTSFCYASEFVKFQKE
jgi:hypothetical protein